jgi:hypothetical protein
MTRYIGNTFVQAKAETTAGTDAAPTNIADAVLVTDCKVTPIEGRFVDRNLLRGYFGSPDKLAGSMFKKVSFTVELAGSGAAATAPQYGDLFIGCLGSEALLSTPSRVEYTPYTPSSTVALKTLTIYVWDDGVLHKLLGCIGSAKISAKIGDRATAAFDFIGLDGGDTAVANPAQTFTAWKTPPVATKANVVDITLGCSYSAGALSGGVVYPSQGLELDLGVKTDFVDTLSAQRTDSSGRTASGSVTMELTAAQYVSMLTSIKTAAQQSLGFTLGLTAGNKLIFYCPAITLPPPSQQDVNGVRMHGFGFTVHPLAGNDDWRIVTQ